MSNIFTALLTTIAGGILFIAFLGAESMGAIYEPVASIGLLLTILTIVLSWVRVWSRSRTLRLLWIASMLLTVACATGVTFINW